MPTSNLLLLVAVLLPPKALDVLGPLVEERLSDVIHKSGWALLHICIHHLDAFPTRVVSTAGAGDAHLGGIIAGLAARGATLEQAACWGVALHALAGERLAARTGLLGYLARELPDEIPSLLQQAAAG